MLHAFTYGYVNVHVKRSSRNFLPSNEYTNCLPLTAKLLTAYRLPLPLTAGLFNSFLAAPLAVGNSLTD